ncbi:MAG: tRNA (adenosine(37)-N6)-threonylcarbamoyltransferase complex dimerization subunit type 1 TsaB [Firmicutes bacterium]|nr:tRNA (adenosine(37)-N6)-threonylcarbamoyltransferase complex dimerization subunit type 1 TsaB [Bacillota bacterium]
MRILGIDSSTLVAGIAVVDETRVILEGFLQTRKMHSERLLPLIDTWLRQAELDLAELDGIAVTIGPGSFTGLRIGIATAKGLAQGAGKPLAGVPTLDAMALNLAGCSGLICPILDARKGEVYTAIYCSPAPDQVWRLSEYQAIAPHSLWSHLAREVWPGPIEPVDVTGRRAEPSAPLAPGRPVTFLGDGVAVYWEEIVRELGSRAYRALPGQNWPRAAQVAFLGLERLRVGGAPSLFEITPAYVRPSEAEVKKSLKEKADKAE